MTKGPNMAPKPEPVVVSTICSLCDQPWESHGDKPTTLDCIRLLKLKAINPFPTIIYRDRVVPSPYPVYPQPYVRPYWQIPPVWSTCETISGGGTSGGLTTTLQNSTSTAIEVSYRTPEDGDEGTSVAAA